MAERRPPIASLEIEPASDSGGGEREREEPFWNRPEYQPTEEIRRSWRRRPTEVRRKKQVNLGWCLVGRKCLYWILGLVGAAAVIAGLAVVLTKTIPRHHRSPPVPDNFTVALRQALIFFNAQRSGKLPENNNVSWRGDSCLNDGKFDTSAVIKDLVGGFYDAGHAIKFNFPASFAMTMLSWSVLEYSAKYEDAGELNHVKEIIKWGNDYLLKTFDNSADKIDRIAAQVGKGTVPDPDVYNDIYCWMRPEDIDYHRPVSECEECSDLAAEMAAALAAASIVFGDDAVYAGKLLRGAKMLYEFSREHLGIYSEGESDAAGFYNSSGYWDELLWGGVWMFYATGNFSYLEIATDPNLAKLVGAGQRGQRFGVLNWDNKLLGAQVLLTRLRIFLGPGYPYEAVLKAFHDDTMATMCATFHTSQASTEQKVGGLILLEYGKPNSLQNVVNAAFLATLFSDYLVASQSQGWDCGATFYASHVLRNFSVTQVQYILGRNPRNTSYVVGYGPRYPLYIWHRGASIPGDGVKYSCKGGWRWYYSLKPNPNTVSGAMVGGPDHHDKFNDTRTNNYSEPTLAGNAGLVASLVALSGGNKTGIDRNLIFRQIRPMFPEAPPPPAPWKPRI